jgi:hypothetical protein
MRVSYAYASERRRQRAQDGGVKSFEVGRLHIDLRIGVAVRNPCLNRQS